jgi:hypothetical protein
VFEPLEGVGPTVGGVFAVDPIVLSGEAEDVPMLFVA